MPLFAIFVIYCFVSAPFKYLVTTVSKFTVGHVLQEIPCQWSCIYGFCIVIMKSELFFFCLLASLLKQSPLLSSLFSSSKMSKHLFVFIVKG